MIQLILRRRALRASLLLLLPLAGCSSAPVTPSADEPSIIVKELVSSTTSWDGQSLPEYPRSQPKVTILKITIPPGTHLDRHRHPVINAGVLTSGELTVVADGGKTLTLKAGDPIVELVNTPHYGINRGSVPAEIIVFYAGDIHSQKSVVEPK